MPVGADGQVLGRALLWSDRRAGAEAAELIASAGGVDALRDRTGLVVDAGSTAAKPGRGMAPAAGESEPLGLLT